MYSKPEFACRYAAYQFLTDTLYSEFEITNQEKNISVFKIERTIKEHERDVDLIISENNPFLSSVIKKQPYLIIPPCISQKLYLADTWDEFLNNFSKNMRKKLRRVLNGGYQYALSRSEAHFQHFYHRMYLPYAKKRFGALFVPDSSLAMKNGPTDNSEMLFLFQEGKLLLGLLQRYDQNKMMSVIAAPAENLTPASLNGAYTAMDYFSIMTAFEKGYRLVDFRESRPFLKNGAYMYKGKWGTSINAFKLPTNDFCFIICQFNNA